MSNTSAESNETKSKTHVIFFITDKLQATIVEPAPSIKNIKSFGKHLEEKNDAKYIILRISVDFKCGIQSRPSHRLTVTKRQRYPITLTQYLQIILKHFIILWTAQTERLSRGHEWM